MSVVRICSNPRMIYSGVMNATGGRTAVSNSANNPVLRPGKRNLAKAYARLNPKTTAINAAPTETNKNQKASTFQSVLALVADSSLRRLPNGLLGRGIKDVNGIHVERDRSLLTNAQC